MVLCDHHLSHKTSNASKIDIVVLAIVGEGNSNLYIYSPIRIIDNLKYIQDNDITVFNTALSCTNVQYSYDEDHHVQKFLSYIYPSIKNSVIEINAGTSIIDHDLNFKKEKLMEVLSFIKEMIKIYCLQSMIQKNW